MTVASTAAKAGPYTGNDVTTSFAFAFKVFADADIRVVETLISTGIETDLVLNDANGYTVTRNADQDNNPGGTVTYKLAGITAALPSTKKLTIVGDFTFEQPTDLPNGGPYFASVVENSLDRIELQVKQLKEVVDRAVVVDVSSTDDPDDLIDSLIAASVAAAASETAAAASAAAAAATLDDFDDLYLGAKAVAPTLDNDGDALVDGALYWNTVSKRLFAYDTGTASWIDALADAANVTYTTPSGTITDVEAMLDKQQVRVNHLNFAYDYSAGTIVVRNGVSDTYHRHFGGIAEGIDGRLHMTYRRGSEHGVISGPTVYYCYSDDGGQTWSAEVAIVASVSGFDNREQSIGVTPTGRVIVIYNKCVAPAAAPTVFKLIYSDDNGVTWTQGADILTVNYAYARTYGRIKVVPGTGGVPYRLVFTPYYQISGTPTYKLAAWYSSDDGLTWTEGAPLQNGVNGNNECEIVAINATVWFGVARGSGLNFYKSTDGGATWTDTGQIATSDGVAPTLDKFCYNGRWYLLVGYCDRTLDTTNFKVCSVVDALTSPVWFGRALTVATDMVNASGYQSTLTKPDGTVYVDGGTAYVEFKEYVGFDYSQVRFQRINLFQLLQDNPRSLTVASGVITLPTTEIEPNMLVSTEGGAATDDLDTISGGIEGQIITYGSATGSSDTIFKNGTGNLHLENEFRLNTAGATGSKIILRKSGSTHIELGRTNDNTITGLTIAAGVVTVPSSRVPIQLSIDTEGAAATDDLDTINGGLDGQIVTFFCPSSSRDVTFKDGTGNMNLAGDFTSTNGADKITVQKQGSTWYQLGRNDNAV